MMVYSPWFIKGFIILAFAWNSEKKNFLLNHNGLANKTLNL